MLSNTLNTNEVKNAAGAEVEFLHRRANERTRTYEITPVNYALPHLLSFAHVETGVGLKRVRRSVVRVDKTTLSSVDSITPITNSFYVVGSIPVGGMTSTAEAANVLAELGSFVFTLGTNTFLYDGTGNGASILLSGGLGS